MKKILFSALFAFSLASCGDLTELNVNPKASETVPYETLFSNAQVEMADLMTSTNVNLNVFRLFSQQWAQVTYVDESNYDVATRAVPDRFWAAIYRDVLRDLQEAKLLIENEPEALLSATQKANELALIDIMEVYAWSVLITTFGDVPYSEALNVDNLLPAYDDAQEIYADLITRLNADIATLKANPGVAAFPAADLLYGGDTENWLRFANSLKLRMGMLIADADQSQARSIVESVDLDMLIDQNQYNASFVFSSAPPNTNPVWEDLVQSGRNDYVPANTLIDAMVDLNDPRLDDYFTMFNGAYVGGIYGSGNTYATASHVADALLAPDYPGMLMSASEVNFYLAEAAARGWNVGGTAIEFYNAAVTESILQYGGTAEEAAAYVLKPEVALVGTSWADESVQQKIGVQSWIALYNRGFEAWTQ